MIPRFRPRFTARELLGLLGAGSAPLADFEAGFARRYGYRHAVWMPYGREAVRCALETIAGLGRLPEADRSVTVAAFNCVALGNGVVGAGWRPRYVDTAPGRFQADPAEFVAAAAESGAAVHVSQWGIVGDEAFLARIPRPIVHDRCLASLAAEPPVFRRDEDCAVYSFGWGKPLGFLRGGMLCGNSDRFAAAWREWREGRVAGRASGIAEARDAAMLAVGLHPVVLPWAMRAEGAPAFRRLSGRDGEESSAPPRDAGRWPSAGGVRGLAARLGALEDLRRERADQIEAYFAALAGVPDVELPERSPTLSHFPIRTAERAALRARLLDAGIFSSDRLFARLLVDYPGLEGKTSGDLRNARELTRTTLHLPLYPGLDADAIRRIAAVVRESRSAEAK